MGTRSSRQPGLSLRGGSQKEETGMSKPKYRRLQFDFAERAVERLDELVNETEAASRAEVIRDALKLYEHLFLRVKEGYAVMIQKGPNEEKSFDIFFQLPEKTSLMTHSQ
jgi:Arc/MetJ-type ribon-helix-helix transcriptional regulator